MLQGGSPAAASPSIVYLLGDDYPWQLWPRAGNAQARALLPRLSETFVDNGLDLQRHYAYALCAPARASLLTGRWPHRVYETSSMRACKGVSPAMGIIAEKLKGAGYATHFVGKWHAGYVTESYVPWRRGFDSAYGFLRMIQFHVPEK